MRTAIAIAATFAFCATLQATETEPPKPDPSCRYEVVTHRCVTVNECKIQEEKFEEAITHLLRKGWKPVGGIEVTLVEGAEVIFDGLGEVTMFLRQAMTLNCEPIRIEPEKKPEAEKEAD